MRKEQRVFSPSLYLHMNSWHSLAPYTTSPRSLIARSGNFE
jgi:hypothetical protein